jgi:hypothetical protein
MTQALDVAHIRGEAAEGVTLGGSENCRRGVGRDRRLGEHARGRRRAGGGSGTRSAATGERGRRQQSDEQRAHLFESLQRTWVRKQVLSSPNKRRTNAERKRSNLIFSGRREVFSQRTGLSHWGVFADT